MTRSFRLAGAFLSVALLAACGGGSGGVSPTLPTSTTPLSAARQTIGLAQTQARAGYKLLYSFKGTPDGASPRSGLAAIDGVLYGTTLNGSPNYCTASCGGNDCYLGCGTIFQLNDADAESSVYNFNGNFNNVGDGSWPFAGMVAVNGVLYGTTGNGGATNGGTVFSVTPSGQERVLHSFAGGADGSGPEDALIALKGKLYGTTLSGGGSGCGGNGCGVVFEITTSGTEHVLYSFAGGSDGANLYSGVTALNGALYGATLFGGGSGCGGRGCGAIFTVSLSGKERVLYRFTGSGDGGYPNGLTPLKGMLYGTTESYGSKESGTVFQVSPAGAFHTIYAFTDIPDGNLPGANLITLNGNLFGTTVGGGTSGNGTAFKVSTAGKESVLYSFAGGTDGLDPQGPLVAFKRNLYGTTNEGGGTGCGGTGCGTIFRVKP